ncbi:sensor histidine kinase [Ramlibacter humi]|uniref:histidine kinase n=1 Tax=Ramlibacter humi TaxID=2530451 RepID=A0A4Z0CEM5_9BURK|nr:sensor histidine kinase [Ramlibacter humi]TFZ08915.1 PAS domain S-box protein [Ramlibacter humi]
MPKWEYFATEPSRGNASRIAWWLAGFALASGGVVGVALWALRGEALRTGEQLTRALSGIIAEQTIRTVQAVDERLQFAAHKLNDGTVERLGAEAGQAMLRDEMADLPYVSALWVVDAHGHLAFATDPGAQHLTDLADRGYYRSHLGERTPAAYVGPLQRSRANGRWQMTISRAIRAPGGELRGVVVASLEPSYFQSVWRGLDVGRGGVVSLLNRNGQLMMRSPAEQSALGRDYSASELFREWLPQSPAGLFLNRSVLDGVDRVIAYRSLPEYPQLVVLVGSSYSELLAPWRQFATLTGAVWLLSLGTAGAIALQTRRHRRRRQHMERRFADLAHAMPQVVFITDGQGVVQFMNERWSDATGRAPREAIGQPWHELAAPEDVDRIRRQVSAQGQPEPLQLEMRLRHRDGLHRWQLVRVLPNRNAEGQVVSWYGTATDVHDLKHAQQRLERQADSLRMASRLARMGGWEIDLATQRVHLSGEAAAILDLPADETQAATDVMAMLRPASREPAERALDRAVQHGEAFDIEVELATAAGRRVWLRSIGYPVREEGGSVVRIQGAQQDITARVRLLAELRDLNATLEERIAQRTRELEKREAELRLANEQLRSFSYSVSHDLQSPIQRIVSFTDAMRGELAGAVRGRAAHYLDRIRANADDMVQLVEGWLVLARVSQGEVARQAVDVSAIARGILEQLQQQSPQRQVAWKVAPGLVVEGDPRLMRLVMDNLLGNAWKFSSRRGQAEIEVGGAAGTGQVFVHDNGAGFDMAHVDKLFGTFQRLHGSDEFPGTGVGLAAVARALTRQGGSIRAESVSGQGATFRFTMPAPPRG